MVGWVEGVCGRTERTGSDPRRNLEGIDGTTQADRQQMSATAFRGCVDSERRSRRDDTAELPTKPSSAHTFWSEEALTLAALAESRS